MSPSVLQHVSPFQAWPSEHPIVINGEDHTESLFYILGYLALETQADLVVSRLKLSRYFDSVLALSSSDCDVSSLLTFCPHPSLTQLWTEQRAIALIRRVNGFLLEVKGEFFSRNIKSTFKLTKKVGKLDALVKKVLSCLHNLDLAKLKTLVEENTCKLLKEYGVEATKEHETLTLLVTTAQKPACGVPRDAMEAELLKKITAFVSMTSLSAANEEPPAKVMDPVQEPEPVTSPILPQKPPQTDGKPSDKYQSPHKRSINKDNRDERNTKDYRDERNNRVYKDNRAARPSQGSQQPQRGKWGQTFQGDQGYQGDQAFRGPQQNNGSYQRGQIQNWNNQTPYQFYNQPPLGPNDYSSYGFQQIQDPQMPEWFSHVDGNVGRRSYS